MKRRLYNFIVPNSVKSMLYRMHIQQYLHEEWKRKNEYERALPHTDLSSIYIKRLNVLTNQSELFGKLPTHAKVVLVTDESWEFVSRVMLVTCPQKLALICSNAGTYPDILRRQFKKQILDDQMELAVGEADQELEKLSDESIDWLYLNANKSYSDMTRLLEIGQMKVKSSGFITGKNYTLGDWVTSQRFEVIEAVHNFIRQHGWEMCYLTNESDRNLSYAIRRICN